MIFVRYPFHCDLKVLDFGESSVNVDLIKVNIESHLGYRQFSLFCNGRKLHYEEAIPDNSTVYVTFSLPGGKGGFGSMLRAIGAQIEKTTNREACRDLSGRRLRDINEEQRLKKWIAKEAEREAEKIKRRQARIERLKSKAPHNFFDFEYEKEISELPNRINDALNEGLQKAKQPKKRPLEKSEATELPKKSWLSDDFPVTSSDSDSDDIKITADSNSKKLKITSKDSSSYDSDMSESSQPCPGSSKDSNFFIAEENTSNESKSISTEGKSEENSTDSDKVHLVQHERKEDTEDIRFVSALDINTYPEDNKTESSTKEIIKLDNDTEKHFEPVSELNSCTLVKKGPETKEDSPIDLLDFQSVSELETLGLDRLKFALMARGLKCGGTLSDRAHRLWKVRGLQPQEYPTNLLAKNKK